MLIRAHNVFEHYDGPAPEATRQLEREGHALVPGVFTAGELAALRAEVLEVYERYPPDRRDNVAGQADVFRYQMIDRSPLYRRAIAHPGILDVVDPLVGEDCHVINCTAWRNPPGEAAQPRDYYWHTDGGPHVPRPAGTPWPAAIPYPIFVVASHIYLEDCDLDDGPTTVVPTSHRSGRVPPAELRFEATLTYEGHAPVTHVARAGDVGFFVSDAWHRRTLPTARSKGRFFLQTNYGRRDIAQRILPVDRTTQVAQEAVIGAMTERERSLLGSHPAGFYDG